MPEITHRMIKTNGIDMHVAECGPPDGKPVIFVHGFPELWRSWRNQLVAVAEAGYRGIAPDMRGYGRTTAPKDVEAYNVHELTNDLAGLVDDLGVDSAAFVGHDWGAWAMWFMSMLHADRVHSLVNISVPFTPRSPAPPVQFMKQLFGDNFFYIVYFQDVGPPEAELSKDVRTTVLKFAWSVSGGAAADFGDRNFGQVKYDDGVGFLDQMSMPPGPLPWFSDEDLEYFVGEFSRTGYFGPVSWYRNIDRNWETTPELDGKAPQQPVLFIAGTNDVVIRMSPPDGMRETIPYLRGIELVEGPGHWIHMEKPEEVNSRVLKFLKEVDY
jgi:pimeloyl-ACP methyl ester carboxylesterase